MFVVRTISQLEEAIRHRTREVMVIGNLAPEMLEITGPSAAGFHRGIPDDFSFTHLFDKFSCVAVYDSSQNVIATVFQQRDGFAGHKN